MRLQSVVRLVAVLLTLTVTWLFTRSYFDIYFKSKAIKGLFDTAAEKKPSVKGLPTKCGIEKACPENYFSFRIVSGAANVVGPSMCLEDQMIMSSVKNNIGRGLNIAFVNGSTGEVLKTGFFDMYSGDVNLLLEFVEPIKTGTLMFLASFDDPATKLNDKARQFFTKMGSNYINKVNFRDNWIFLGGSGLAAKSPYEEHLKNDKDTNKYDGWPEVLEMEGCIPKKMG